MNEDNRLAVNINKGILYVIKKNIGLGPTRQKYTIYRKKKPFYRGLLKRLN